MILVKQQISGVSEETIKACIFGLFANRTSLDLDFINVYLFENQTHGVVMTNREKANQIVTEAIQAQNMMLSEDMQISLDPSTHLTGDSGVLDSLGFVTFIVNLEEQASTLFSIDISVSDAAVMDDMDKYFETIGNLTEYITNLIDKVS